MDHSDDDNVIVDDVSNRKTPLKKPKVGFINNQVIDKDDAEKEKDETEQQNNPDGSKMFDEDLEIDQETINNNVKKAIDRMDTDDLDLDKMMNFSDSNSNLDRSDVNTDDCDVNRCDVKWSDESDVTGNDVSVPEKKTKPKACGCGFKINKTYLDKFKREKKEYLVDHVTICINHLCWTVIHLNILVIIHQILRNLTMKQQRVMLVLRQSLWKKVMLRLC